MNESIVQKHSLKANGKGGIMKSLITRISFIALYIITFIMLLFVKDASSCDEDCKYERKKFAAEQMIKYKRPKASTVRSSTLVGIDALFL